MINEIMCSQRGNMYLIEYATIFVSKKTVVVKHSDKEKVENIPIKNTVSILLGAGTDITTMAKIELAKANVPIGCIGSTTGKFFGGVEIFFDNPSSIARTTKFSRSWIINTLNENKKVEMSQYFLLKRFELAEKYWDTDLFYKLKTNKFSLYVDEFPFDKWKKGIYVHKTIPSLVDYEDGFMNNFYKVLGNIFNENDFDREPLGQDKINVNITLGNSIAYGLSNSVVWTLGIPLCFPIIHGNTNGGGLVYDIADLIKFSIVIPMAFAYSNVPTKVYTKELIDIILKNNILADIFKIVEETAVL